MKKSLSITSISLAAAMILSMSLPLTVNAVDVALTLRDTEEPVAAYETEGFVPDYDYGDALTTKELTAYVYSMDKTETLTCVFVSSLPDMPYISTVDYLKHIYKDEPTEEPDPDVTYGTYTITNPKGTMVVDTVNETLHFDYFEGFVSAAPNVEGTSLDSPYCKENGTTHENDVNELDLDLSEYNIDILEVGGKSYFPLSTISLLFGETYNAAIYNEDCIYFVHCSDIVSSGATYFDKTIPLQTLERSDDLTALAYNELCFAIDKLYGRPASSEIASTLEEMSFDKALEEYSDDTRHAKELLLSNDKAEYLLGMCSLGKIFDDGGHTALYFPFVNVLLNSDSAVGQEIIRKQAEGELTESDKNAIQFVFSATGAADKTGITSCRSENFSKYETVKTWDDESKSGLVISGDTAVFSFDSFANEAVYNLKWSLDYAKEKGVKRFVIDLSCNGGGNSAVVVYIMTLLTNNNKDNNSNFVRNLQVLTDNITRTNYLIDLNLDGEINDLDKEVYYDFEYAVITSKYSYSCGNLLPCLAKDVGIPVLGQRSGGGACSIMIPYTSEGFYFSMSCYNKYITKDNKDVDSGAELDYELAKLVTDDQGNTTVDYSGLYDIESINKMIDEFYGVSEEPSEQSSEQSSEQPSEQSSEQTSKLPTINPGIDSPATGDSTPFIPVVIILTLAASVCMIIFCRRKTTGR